MPLPVSRRRVLRPAAYRPQKRGGRGHKTALPRAVGSGALPSATRNFDRQEMSLRLNSAQSPAADPLEEQPFVESQLAWVT